MSKVAEAIVSRERGLTNLDENEQRQNENLHDDVKKRLRNVKSLQRSPTHFKQSKYLMTDSEGRDLTVVICQKHSLLFQWKPVHRRLGSGS